MKIVLDTNVLVSGIFWGGLPRKIIELAIEKSISLYATESIVREYFRIIDKIGKKDLSLSNEWKMLLLDLITIIESNESIKICRDPYDDMFIECAVSCGASYILSGDDDLLSLEKFNEIEIVTAKSYLAIIKERPNKRST